jgi:hypothetical protein
VSTEHWHCLHVSLVDRVTTAGPGTLMHMHKTLRA